MPARSCLRTLHWSAASTPAHSREVFKRFKLVQANPSRPTTLALPVLAPKLKARHASVESELTTTILLPSKRYRVILQSSLRSTNNYFTRVNTTGSVISCARNRYDNCASSVDRISAHNNYWSNPGLLRAFRRIKSSIVDLPSSQVWVPFL